LQTLNKEEILIRIKRKEDYMMKKILLLTSCVLLIATAVTSQELVISGFPVGVGGSVDQELFEPYYSQIQKIADTLKMYPDAYVVITGSADGINYTLHNDSRNPSLALGRAHVVRNLLVNQFEVDSNQIMIQSNDVKSIGDKFRAAKIKVYRYEDNTDDLNKELVDLKTRLEDLENKPPVEKHFTEVQEITNTLADNFGLQLSAGMSSSPFGGIPTVSSAVTWKRKIFVDAIFGHTFWDDQFIFEDEELDTKLRMAGARVTIYPKKNFKLGLVGGWMHIEKISQQHFEYVELTEGPIVGLKARFSDKFGVSFLYNPSKYRVAEVETSTDKKNQFLLLFDISTIFGGGK
jgi:hypothetical protein